MTRKTSVSLALGAIVSAGALYLSFRNVPLKELASYFHLIQYRWVVLSIGISLSTFAIRGIRWQVILSSSYQVRLADAYHPLIIGFAVNCILPGRVGELARPAILLKREGVPYSTGLATVAAERAFDITLILMLFVAVLALIDIDPDVNMAFGGYHLNRNTLVAIGQRMIGVMVLLIVGMACLSIRSFREWIKRFVLQTPQLFIFLTPPLRRKIQETVASPIAGIIDSFAAGFAMIRSIRKMAWCMTLSILIWGLSIASYYVMALGCPGIDVSFVEMAAVLIIICFFIALPSVPGFWGIWEAGGVFALSLFGIESRDAAGYTLANHAVQVFPVIAAGWVSAIVTGINLLQVSQEKG